MSKTFVFVIGTRAQLVKMAPLMRATHEAGHRIGVVLTGQHFDSMSELAVDLGVMEFFPTGELAVERSTVLKLLTWLPNAFFFARKRLGALSGEGPAIVLVHGDTISTLLGAVAARSLRLPVAHVESGLSSGRLIDPFPEELIRRLVSRLTTYAVCPSEQTSRRMRAYGVKAVIDSEGNTIADALSLVVQADDSGTVQQYDVIASIHRFENIRARPRLQAIVSELEQISRHHRIAFVLHPATATKLRSFGLHDRIASCNGIDLLPRMSYSRFISLARSAEVIVTDGGSNQEEFALLGIPTIILRTRSERPDGIGVNAILEADLGQSLADYVLSGAASALRRTKKTYVPGAISTRIVTALANEMAGFSPGSGKP